jgi:hypothetical protein
MRSRTWLVLAALAAVPVGSALAQSGGVAQPSAPVEGGGELLAKADAVVERLQSATVSIQRQLDVARSQRDVVKVLFLSEKLSQANASLRSAIERRASVKAALERGDAASARQDAEVLSIIGERGDEYLNATSQAVGEGTRMQESATVNVTTEPGTPTAVQTSEYPTVDPLTGAADSNGRSSSSQTGGTSSSASDVPVANANTVPDAPAIPISASPR